MLNWNPVMAYWAPKKSRTIQRVMQAKITPHHGRVDLMTYKQVITVMKLARKAKKYQLDGHSS